MKKTLKQLEGLKAISTENNFALCDAARQSGL